MSIGKYAKRIGTKTADLATVPLNLVGGLFGNPFDPLGGHQVINTQSQIDFLNNLANQSGKRQGVLSYGDYGTNFNLSDLKDPTAFSTAMTMGGTGFTKADTGDITYSGGKYDFDGAVPFIDQGGLMGKAYNLGGGLANLVNDIRQRNPGVTGTDYFDDVDISQPPGTDVGIMNNLSNLTNLFGSSARADEIEPIDVENFLEANRLNSTPDVVDVNRIQEAVEPQYRIRDQLSRDFLQGGLFRDAKQGLGQTKNALLDDFGQLREGLGSITNRGMNLFDLAKDKGIDLGRTIASGIGRYALGPIGGILGSLIGRIKESPTDKFNLEIGKEFGDRYGYKGQLSSGTMGGRQDPFGRNLVSAFGNYEKNRMAEVARLSALENLNKIQKAKLDFGKNYLEKLEEKRQEKIREMQAQNAANKTGGGYQAGYSSDFMDGPSGTISGQNEGLGGQQGKAGGTATMGSS